MQVADKDASNRDTNGVAIGNEFPSGTSGGQKQARSNEFTQCVGRNYGCARSGYLN